MFDSKPNLPAQPKVTPQPAAKPKGNLFGEDEDDDLDESLMFDKPPDVKIDMPTAAPQPAKKPGLFDDEDDEANESIMLPPKTKPNDLFGDDPQESAPPTQTLPAPAKPAEPQRPSYARGPGGDLMAEMMKKN